MIRNCQAESHVVGPFGKGVFERGTPDALRAEPRPGLAAVGADGRTAGADDVALGEMERKRPPAGAADAKLPIEPEPGRIALILVQVDPLAFDPLKHDIAAGKIAIDGRPLSLINLRVREPRGLSPRSCHHRRHRPGRSTPPGKEFSAVQVVIFGHCEFPISERGG